MAPKIEPGKLPDHAIEDIYVGNSKETLDIVDDLVGFEAKQQQYHIIV